MSATAATSATATSIFAELRAAYPTWDALSAFLQSEEGGRLSVVTDADSPLAVIRYVKTESQQPAWYIPHVRAFRSVVWNTETHRPVSVTAFKSEMGESLPALDANSDIQMEAFVDGVMIGQFWDAGAQKWRIHTRSTLDAKARYFSQTRTFSEMFDDAIKSMYAPLAEPFTARLDKSVSYTWILSHPENRIVTDVKKPAITLVAQMRLHEEGTVDMLPLSEAPEGVLTPATYPMLENQALETCVQSLLTVLGALHGYQQGVIFKSRADPFKRWKMRTATYNTIRHLRGNTARRDFLLMDLQTKGRLEDYLRYYPEERLLAQSIGARWREVTQQVFRCYTDVFKARTTDKMQIPAKIRPLVHGLHGHYLTTLRPVHKTVDWNTCVQWMNERDTAQKIFVLNWDLRQEKAATATTVETA